MSIIFWQQVLKVFIALFIITDSVGNLPFFMGMTEGMEKKERRGISVAGEGNQDDGGGEFFQKK